MHVPLPDSLQSVPEEPLGHDLRLRNQLSGTHGAVGVALARDFEVDADLVVELHLSANGTSSGTKRLQFRTTCRICTSTTRGAPGNSFRSGPSSWVVAVPLIRSLAPSEKSMKSIPTCGFARMLPRLMKKSFPSKSTRPRRGKAHNPGSAPLERAITASIFAGRREKEVRCTLQALDVLLGHALEENLSHPALSDLFVLSPALLRSELPVMKHEAVLSGRLLLNCRSR